MVTVERRAAPNPEKITFPPKLKDVIVERAFTLAGFDNQPNATVVRNNAINQVYLGEVCCNNMIALNLIVLEQIRFDKNGRKSVGWRFASYEGDPIKEAVSRVRSKREKRSYYSRIMRRPKVTPRKDLGGKILEAIRDFESN